MMRKNSLFILLLVALLSLPAFAFADTSTDELSGGKGVGWQGVITSGDDAGLYGAAGRARNKYNMACWVMGKNPLTIADEVRSKLSDPSYGGRFYEYANTFESIPSWEYVPEWQPTYANLTYVLYGFDFQWESAVPQSLYEGAKEDFRRVLAGEELGGGGGTSTNGDYTVFTLQAANVDDGSPTSSVNGNSFTAYYASFNNGECVLTGGSTKVNPWVRSTYYTSSMRIFVSPQVMEFLDGYLSQGYEVVFGYGGASILYVGHDLRIEYSTVGRTTMYRIYGSDIKSFSDPCGLFIDSDGPYCYFHRNLNISLSSDSSPIQNGYKSGEIIDAPFVSPPSGDWPEPETPVTPTAPEIPTPTAPTDTPDPTPTEPTVVWPTAPIVVNPPEVTVEVTPSGLDYTELLTRINDNLNELNSYVQAINGSLNSLRSDIIGGFDDVVTSLRNIYQYLQHLNDILELHCKHLRDALDDGIYNLELYIKSLFEWLPQQLDFDAKFDYDDTAVTSLLRRILGKIPGGSGDAPTSYMPNPQADEPGFFDWLLDLWHRFLIDLVSVLPDELGGLVDAFSQLTHYFPFSIPWDLAALLALFEHEPVTPVFDVPWGFGGEEGEIEMVRVDLSAWDGVMEMVRPVFVVGFCWQLAMITKELLGNFDINKGGV